ncbi:MAG: hypothetical protein AAF333_01965 [Planctomycetota bacterium]
MTPEPAPPRIPTTPTPWRPPSPEALEAHFAQHPPRPAGPWAQRTPLFVLVGVVLLALAIGGPAAWLLPWGAFVGLLVYGSQKVNAMRRFEARLARAAELATLRHHRPALRSAWRLIPELADHPALQHRAVVVIAQVLDQLDAHDAAIVAYNRLLDDLPGGHPGATMLKIHRAIAALFTHQLSDADDALRRLRGPVEEFDDATPTAAAYRFALLFQSVQTAHYAEAIEESGDLLDALRPLGIDAGYGHALLAWCHRQRNDAEAQDDVQARTWWRRATALVPAAALVRRFPELREVRGE